MSKGITITINAATSEAVAKLQEFFNQTSEGLNKLTQAGEFLTGMGSKIAEAFTFAAIVEQFKHAIDSAEEMGHAMEKTGLSLKALNAIKVLGDENRLPFEEVTLGLSLFNDKIFNAAREGGDAARVFRDLHIAITDTSGALLPTEAVLEKVMDRFKGMADGQVKSASAMELFGRAGREWIPMLNEGSAALEKMKAQGGGLTPEMIENARQFNAALVELGNSLKQIFLDASASIVPVLKDLADWLKNLETSTNGEMTAAQALVDVFKTLAFVVIGLKSAFVLLGEGMGNQMALEWDTLMDGANTAMTVFAAFRDSIKSTVAVLMDLMRADTAAATVMAEASAGQLKLAWDTARKSIIELTTDLKGASNAFASQTTTIAGFLERTASRTKETAKLMWDELLKEADTYTAALNAITGMGAKKGSGKGGGGDSASGLGSGDVIKSEAAKKLEAETLKAYQEAFLGKMALLKLEHDARAKAIQAEITDDEDKYYALHENDMVYAKQKQDLLDKEAEARQDIQRKMLNVDLERVKGDPNQSQQQKTPQELANLREQLALAQQDASLQSGRSNNPALTDEERLNAQKQLVESKSQELKLTQQIQALESQNFTGKMEDGLAKLQTEWGNLGQNVGGGALQSIQTAVGGITQGIMDSIERTKTWGQVFLQVGRSIVANIIQIMVQWVVSTTIIAGMKTALAAVDKAMAAASAASWAPAATAASIASYGSAAEVGASAASIAMASSVATGFMAAGGFVKGPGSGTSDSIPTMLSHGEFVIPAHVVSSLNPSILAALQTGDGLHDNAISNLPKPITSDARAFQEMMASGAATRGAASAGNVSVQGHKMNVGFFSSSSEAKQYLNTQEGEKHVVDIARRRRVDIGVGT